MKSVSDAHTCHIREKARMLGTTQEWGTRTIEGSPTATRSSPSYTSESCFFWGGVGTELTCCTGGEHGIG